MKTKKGRPPSRDTRRRLEQLSANPRCEANVLSVIHDVPMGEVARELGLAPKDRQSRFAIARGVTFERGLFADGAATLLEALIKAGVLPAGSEGLLDLRLRMNGGPIDRLDGSASQFARFVDAPDGKTVLVAGAALPVPGAALLPDGLVAVDVIAVRPNEQGIELVIGEVKVYPDRAGYTDTANLASARRQAGLYVAMLRRFVAERGLEHAITVRDRGFLVLSRVGSNRPVIRADEDFAHQAQAAEALLAELGALAARPAVSENQRLATIAEAPTHYCEGCVSFCELADRCHAEARTAGAPALLGDDAARILGQVSVPRALTLLRGAAPANDVERDLARRLAAVEVGR